MVLGRFCIGTMVAIRRPPLPRRFKAPKVSSICLIWVRMSAVLQISFNNLHAWVVRCSRRTKPSQRHRSPSCLAQYRDRSGQGYVKRKRGSPLIENDHTLHSVGFIEPSELFSGQADVVVCDGTLEISFSRRSRVWRLLRAQLAQLPVSIQNCKISRRASIQTVTMAPC